MQIPPPGPPLLLKNDPKRPTALVARDLGVSQEQFIACFANVNPSPQGTRPTSERVHANKAVLLSCLQRANPTITNDGLDTVMDRYRPGGREAQMPVR
ncbi:hypothetical protein EJ903_22690 [Azospirillum griseum]|uniref:Uncharacterized protein n=2 Tax=Azospirillum griseum TaxID=2496639 RepID=A0A3S0HXK8_9PROT|nr:hypothetical protein EJ903_22690 [Azospirillum griseum]